jgi:hypothetical protein
MEHPVSKIVGVPAEIPTEHLLNEYSTVHMTVTSKCLLPTVKKLTSGTSPMRLSVHFPDVATG